jgi:hypothetical protein
MLENPKQFGQIIHRVPLHILGEHIFLELPEFPQFAIGDNALLGKITVSERAASEVKTSMFSKLKRSSATNAAGGSRGVNCKSASR